MTKYTILDLISGENIERDCETLKEAHKEAREWMEEAYEADEDPTTWWDYVIEWGDGESDSGTITVHPVEPECEAREHEWSSPWDIVGGCEENPGVWGSGGGVKIHEYCPHCGWHRWTDTWATRPDTGEQGLERIWYCPPEGEEDTEPQYYECEKW